MAPHPLDLLPASGDGSYLGTEKGSADVYYLRDVAGAADRLGFGGALLSAGTNCLDGRMVGSALASQSKRLKFLFALRPGFFTPGLVARQSAHGSNRWRARGQQASARHPPLKDSAR